MQNHIRAFVELAVEAFELEGPVYDFSDFQADGRLPLAPWRPLFLGRRYLCCGTRQGPGVDRLVDPTRLALADGSARTVIGVDFLQRVFEPQRAADELRRVLAPGGVLLLAAATDGRLKDRPDVYWHLTPNCLGRLLAPLDATLVGWQGAERSPHTVFGIGCKAPLPGRLATAMQGFIEGYQRWVAAAGHTTPWLERLTAAGALCFWRRAARCFGRRAAPWFAVRSQPETWRDFHQVQFSFDMPTNQNWTTGLLPSYGKVNFPARLDLS